MRRTLASFVIGLHVLAAFTMAPIVAAQEEELTDGERWAENAETSAGKFETKAGTYSCSSTGCVGTFSAMVESIRTINNGSELIILRNAVADTMRAAGACPNLIGDGIIVDGAGKDTIIGKLYVGLALDTRFHLRVAPSGTNECKIFYVRVFT